MQLNMLNDLAEAMKALDGKKSWFFLVSLLRCVGRYALLTGGSAFLPNAFCVVLFLCHRVMYSYLVRSGYLLLPSIFVSHSGPSL